jgi:tetratricopeptide (TPR) repeat protein
MKRFFILVGLAGGLLFPCVRAEAQDDQYVQIYNLIQEADGLNTANQPGQAMSKYIEAQTALASFQKVYPDWNSRVVSFRLNYLGSRIAEMSGKLPPVSPAAAGRSGTNASVTGVLQSREQTGLETRLNALQNQVRQLEADKELLQAKLKEALSAQPAAVDPRELMKAEEKIRFLAKENSLLQVSLAQQQSKAGSAADTELLNQFRRDLADTRRKLAGQTQKADALALEKQALQKKLDDLAPASGNAPELEATRKALEDTSRKLVLQSELESRFSKEKETLQSRIKALEADADAAAVLRAENVILKKQLAGLKRPPSARASTRELNRQLAEAQAQIAALKSDKDILRLEKIALQDRVRQLSASPPPASASAGAVEDAVRISQLEQERSDLRKQLEAAQRDFSNPKRKSAASRVEGLASQLESLRARLSVYEAQQAPYSREELTLFKQGQSGLAPATSRGGSAAAQEPPAGTATLVAEARRDFATRQFDKAEQKYLQVLRKDQTNVYTLANLATIQLELGHVDDAEKHVQQALALNPDDAYSLRVLGEIRFRRKKYDEALEVLSRAAELDPQSAEIQNFLGLTLSQKGMRHPAETAFRKALQQDPNYAGAHYNLAVFYLTQKPAWPELARWHYRKALAGGFPPNPDFEKMLDRSKAEEVGH